MEKALGTWEIDSLSRPEKINKIYSISLRLWSDITPFRPLAERLDLKISTVHVAGEPMADMGRLSKIIAPRHYLSAETCAPTSLAEIDSWCIRVLNIISNDCELSQALQVGTTYGVVWIALFPPHSDISMPLEGSIIKLAQKLKIRIICEYYNNIIRGKPLVEDLTR